MKQIEETKLWDDVEKVKNFHERNYNQLTSNFYIVKAALRYYSVKQGKSITSTQIAENFPLTAPVIGSALKILEELNIIENRNDSESKKRYLPQNVKMKELVKLEKILLERHEIDEFA